MKLQQLFEWSADQYGSRSRKFTIDLKPDITGVKAKLQYEVVYKYLKSEGAIHEAYVYFYQIGEDAPLEQYAFNFFIGDTSIKLDEEDSDEKLKKLKDHLKSLSFYDMLDAFDKSVKNRRIDKYPYTTKAGQRQTYSGYVMHYDDIIFDIKPHEHSEQDIARLIKEWK
jgi:hypothetical protein